MILDKRDVRIESMDRRSIISDKYFIITENRKSNNTIYSGYRCKKN